jgi:photosynthetic reaction center cytochrome c subunit
MSQSFGKFAVVAAVGVAALLAGCESPTEVKTVQRGYRGVGMVENYNRSIQAASAEKNALPAALPAAEPGSASAASEYQNVQILTDLDVNTFTRLMVAMTQWVAPEQGCTYCHTADLASDELYTKVVSRQMLKMTRDLNSKWKDHVAVAGAGVTCYTCHRGQPVPANIWFKDPGPKVATGPAAPGRSGQNTPAAAVAYAALPYDPFTPFLKGSDNLRVTSLSALPDGTNKTTLKEAEATFGLMAHMSKALGVNCTYCHNTRTFNEWSASTPQRATSWYGLSMVRDINNNYLQPLASHFPANRLGPTGDVPKANCATCHQGTYKPLYGASQLKDYPELAVATAVPVAAKPAPAAEAAAVQDENMTKGEKIRSAIRGLFKLD